MSESETRDKIRSMIMESFLKGGAPDTRATGGARARISAVVFSWRRARVLRLATWRVDCKTNTARITGWRCEPCE